MAHASGTAIDGLMHADFTHAASQVRYRIYDENGKAWLSFERPGDPAVRGKRELLYYVGSGRRGRSYVFADDGFLFESPINWYANRRVWDLVPAYGNSREIPLNLPVYTSCLHCHVSGMKPPETGTENKYPIPAFIQAGVGCERCHGPGEAHLRGGAIINPAKLSPERRDGVCMQCHLEGKVAIERPGRHEYQFQAGEDLADYVRYFVLNGSQSGLGAVSQFEAFAQSTCKKKSGNSMSCMSCHDPHSSPTATERADYYRGKCLACHGAAFGKKHHPETPDCTSCHMPPSLSTDIAHTEVTDHRILRRPEVAPQLLQPIPEVGKPRLVPFPASEKTDARDEALAWESVVESGMTTAEPMAEQALRTALRTSPEDPAVLSALGYIAQRQGATESAQALYQKALAIDPTLVDAATNLAVIDAKVGHLQEAVKLWQGAFERAPYRSGIGMNLAKTFCETKQYNAARDYVLRVLEFNPDLSSAKELLNRLNSSSPSCQ